MKIDYLAKKCIETKPNEVYLIGVLDAYKGLEGYGIDKTGYIWSFKSGDWVKLTRHYDTKGYQCFKYYFNGKKRTDRVHRILAMLFIDNPENKVDVNHKDGDRKNNNIDNLEWCTRSENIKHAYSELNHPRMQGVKSPKSKLNDEKVREIRKLCQNGLSQRAVANIMNIHHSIVGGIMKGIRWAHVV